MPPGLAAAGEEKIASSCPDGRTELYETGAHLLERLAALCNEEGRPHLLFNRHVQEHYHPSTCPTS